MKLWVPIVKLNFKQVEFGHSANHGKASGSARAKKHKVIYITASLLVIAVLAGGYVWHTLGTPNYGQVAIISQETSPTTKLPDYTSLTTNYYSLDYSQRYSQVPSDIPPAGILDQKILAYNLGGRPGQSRIEIDIKAAPDGGITLDSSYDYYLKRSAQYKLSNRYYHGEAIDIARSQTGAAPETAGMWLHGGFLMVAKITTADPKQNIDAELKDLLSSVQWRG